MDVLRENIISLLVTGVFYGGYYISSKILQASRNDLDHFKYAPVIRDFNQLATDWDSEYPYAVVEGEVQPNYNAIHSLYDPFTKGVVRNLKTWKLKKIWNVVTRNWDMGSSLHASFESDVPMHIEDRNNSKIYVQDFSDANRYKLLQQVSNFTEPVNDPIMKRILENIIHDEIVVGYKRVEKMLKVGTKVLFCGKLTRELDGLKYIFRVSKPDFPFKYSSTSASYVEYLAMKTRGVKKLNLLTVLLGSVTAILAVSLIIRCMRSVIDKQLQRMEAEQLRKQLQSPDITELGDTQNDTAAAHRNIMCSICYERPVRVLVKNCNHACLCGECALKVKGLCPICRAPISKFEKIYFS